MTEPMARLVGLTKVFGDNVAVDHLDLEIPPGQVFAFLGPNGAGKTTTIRMMTGLIRPTGGEVFIGGHDIQKRAIEAKSLTGYIPDHPYLYEKLSARDFIHFVGDLHGIPRAVQDERMMDHFDLFSLSNSADHLIENFSHGMRQKLVFTAALLHQPTLLVFDEPMVGLDPKSARIIKQLMRRHAERGAAVFLSTHQLSVAEEVADRIGIIEKGKLLFLGSLAELRQRSRAAGTLEDLFLELTGEPPEEIDI
jgi:ABC-2 type transport system ATP-binding protein